MNQASETEKNKSEREISMPHKRGTPWLVILGVIVAVIIVVAAAFATGLLSTGKSGRSVSLTGAGATFPMPLILKWSDEYYNTTGHNVRISYGGGGSGAGITQIEDRHVDFAGTDAPLATSDSSAYGLVHIPETLGAVVVAFNEPSIQSLRLDGPTLAEIFMKNITSWDDPAIAALNPGEVLPSFQITTIVRSDSSGTTFVFSGYLATVSSEFAAIYGQGKSVNWPDAIGASGNPGVTQTVKTTAHSIGYIELSYAMANDVPHAILKNHDGYFVNATLESVTSAATGVVLPAGDGDWSHVSILDAAGAESYPISSFTYILVYKELFSNDTKMNKTAAEALIDFLWWCVHQGQSYGPTLYYASLPASVVSVDETTLNSITYQGQVVR